MSSEDIRNTLSAAWRTAAKSLSIRIEAPYLLKGVEGIEVSCVAYLPDFGGPNGMVIGFICRPAHKDDPRLKLVAESRCVFYSFINYKVYGKYDEETYKEALADWGYFGNETLRPVWMRKPAKGK